MASSTSKGKAIFRVVSGNFLEMFDFMVYGFYATAIAKTFFPSDSAFASLMLSLATFGAGFLMRPLGAIFLGAYIDRHGRRKGLIITLAMMAMGTLLIACVPGYATLGVIAPLLVLLGRLLQGFSAGVELGGVSVYLAEISTPGRKGFFVSWQSASQQAAVVFAGLLGVGLNHWLSPEQMGEWGWRVPFLIGCLIVPAIFIIRRSLEESPEFEARTHRPTLREVVRSIGQNFGLVLGGMALVVMTTVTFYLITAYTPTFGKNELNLTDLESLLVTVCVGVSNFIWLPIMGSFSDRIGRKPLLIAATVLAIATAYPALSWLVAHPSFGNLLMVELWLSFLYGSYNGAMVVALTEIMPVDVRTTGFSLAYSLATATFGGFTPAACTYLIHELGNKAAPGIWLTGAAVLGLIATLVLFRKNGQKLEAPVAASAS
ncbi:MULTISPECIES: MFS transporter [Pseudomonas syringae group]|uniref:Citrate-proton symporter n=4 Tax=Pseudomonas syringae group TaxID=136849 RepID=A0AA40P1W3_9PSED|nr:MULTISPECIES: MFS transporter [Pseudomonas syringae group]KOP54931.1 citrate-proton symporter [Pseudomonas coronafaciens pv. porri]KPB55866.1 Citrate-proton symporter [Pseudomonas coronafaciens pv. oryzae]KPW29013.1 Citrate-proton symporter [Pseudomonas coronafaciens pv. atropurpurea]KPX32440.1 Citrate-proton symporter [Pseudomonas coronafaciens pv. garcae]KPY06890.1 Citrate-proton symporter [Pseudomonas coronafaciens pv. oryzae]